MKSELNIYLGYRLLHVNCGFVEQTEHIEQRVPKCLHHFHQHVITVNIEKLHSNCKIDTDYPEICSCVDSLTFRSQTQISKNPHITGKLCIHN